MSSGASEERIDADFAYLKGHGVHVVRWFLFGDCRAAPEFNDEGEVTDFDQYFYPDLDLAVDIARKHNVLVGKYDDRAVPRIIDFGVAKATE